MTQKHLRQSGFSDTRIADDQDVMVLMENFERSLEPLMHDQPAKLASDHLYASLRDVKDARMQDLF
jgi:hypothetical protein